MELILGLSHSPGIPPAFVVGENPVAHIVPMPFGLVERCLSLRGVELFRDIRTGHAKSVRLGSCVDHGNRGADEECLKVVSSPAFRDRFASVHTCDRLHLGPTIHVGPARFRPPIEAVLEGPTVRLSSANHNCSEITEAPVYIREAQ